MATQWTDITQKSKNGYYEGYIRYANQLLNISAKTDTPSANAIAIYNIKENTHYKVGIFMQCRFRLGCISEIVTGQTVSNYVYDPLDTNAGNNIGVYRELEIISEAGQTYLVVGAWGNACSTGKSCTDTLASIIVYEEQEIPNPLTGIFVTTLPTKADYLMGESFSPSGMVVTGSYEDGTSAPIAGYTVSGYDTNTAGVQTLTVAYENFTAPIMVTVHGLTSLNITANPTKLEYLTGDTLDTTGLVVSATYDEGSTKEVTGYTLSGFDSSQAGTQTITVSYYGLTTGFDILVHGVTGISITPPTKTVYSFGEPLDTTGLNVTLVCSDGYTQATTDYTLSGYNTTVIGEQTVTVTYKAYTENFSVTVESTITGIEITTPPTKVSYKQGEAFDGTGLVVFAILQDESRLTVTDYTLSGFDSTVLGTDTITATYQGQTANFNVTIVQNILTATCGTPTLANVTATLDVYTGILSFAGTGAIKSYTSTTAPFISYISTVKAVVIGEGITNLGNYLFYKNTKLTSVTLPSTVGTIGTYVFYGCSALTEITNVDKITYLSSYAFYGCTGLTSLSLGSALTYIASNTFSSCSKLTSIHLDLEYGIISGSPWGASYATVTWATYPLARLELLTPPDKIEYRYGESFNSTGTIVRVFYTDGSSRDISTLSLLTFGGYSSTKLGSQNITITYRTVSTSTTVSVINYETGIRIITPPTKLTYEVGEVQDNTGLVVGLVFADGSTQEIPDYTVSPIDYELLGPQTIMVTHGDYSAGFDITGNFPTTLAKLMGATNNMVIIRNNSKNDDATDTLTGVDWFQFNGVVAQNLYISGNNWLGFGSIAEQLKVCRRDGAVWYERRLEGMLTNGHRFLKLEIEGYTYYSSTSSTYRLVYEVYLFDDNSMFLNILTTPTSSSYLGTSALVCGNQTVALTLQASTPVMYSFYPQGEGGTDWSVQAAQHKYLITGIDIQTPADKTAYRFGEKLDLTGLVVVLSSTLGKSEEVTEYTVSGFDPFRAGTQTLLISYQEYTTSYDITMTDGFTVRFLYFETNTGKDVLIDTQTVNYGHDAVPPAVDRPGYVFTGWNDSFLNVTFDRDIYAEFIPKNICTVLFVDYKGAALKKQYVPRGGAATAPAAPAREGFIFTGWDCNFSYVTSDLTVTALYEGRSDTYPVTFLGWDGTVLKIDTVGYAGSATPPTPPARSGYFFFAWSVSFGYVTQALTTQAIYRKNRLEAVAEVYNGNQLAGRIRMAISCTLTQRLNGECTLELTTLASNCAFVEKRQRIEFDGLIFDLTGIEKKTQNGTYLTTLKAEHVSYILNDEEYDVTEFSFTGSPAQCLGKVLRGTPFSVGTVDFTESVTLQVNQEATRRDVLMQLVALCGGELEYDGYKIGIRNHLGSTTPIELMDTENVKNVGMSYSAAEHTETYSIELYQKLGIALGDEIHIVFTPLDINKTKRITGLEWNPFNFRSIKVSVGGYRASINDSLYQVSDDTDNTSERVDELSNKFDDLSDTFDSLSGSLGGFNVMSVSELPSNPDMNTIYLIQGTVEVG